MPLVSPEISLNVLSPKMRNVKIWYLSSEPAYRLAMIMPVQKPYTRGMQTKQARRAMLGLITALLFILVVTILQPFLLASFDGLLPVIKKHPLLFYILTFFCILLAVYIVFGQKRQDTLQDETG